MILTTSISYRTSPLLALGILLIPDALWALRAESPGYALQHGLLFSFCVLLGALAWSRRRPGALLLLGLPFALLVPLECYYIWRYSIPSSAHVLAIVGETNFIEASEFIGYPLAGGLTLATLLIGFIYIREIRSVGLKPLYPAHRAWRWLGVAMLLPFASLSAAELALAPADKPRPELQQADERSNLARSLLKDVRFGMNKVLSSSFPFGVPFRINTYLAEQARLAEAAEQSKNIQVFARTPTDTTTELLVLVIGESAQPGHWHANGYFRQTTPEIEKEPNAVSLSNVISPWNATRLAVPSLLTGLVDKDGLPAVAEPSIIDVFRSAGWQTYWLSNQSPLGMHDSTIVTLANRAQQRHFLNGADYTQAADYDEVLLPTLDKVLKEDPAQKKLIVMHLLGSHVLYESRYPKAFAKFDNSTQIDPKVGAFSPMHDVYDNSILYTDFILGQIISRLKNSNTVSALVYSSDHGQSMPSLACNKFGHGHLAVDNFRVAALTWISPEFERHFPGTLERLKTKKSAPLHLRDIFHTMIDMSGIEYGGLNTSRSWANQNWQPGPRPVGVLADFDTAQISGPCQMIAPLS